MKIKCERLDNFGRGIGLIDGKVIFIPNFLPEEKAEIVITENKKNYMEGKITKIYKSSSKRILPQCPYKECGCHINHIKYEEALEFKKQKVKDILKRLAKIDINNIDIISSDKIIGYRNKITLKVKNGMIGYYKNSTHSLINIDKCIICNQKINKILQIIKKCDLSSVKSIVIKSDEEVMIIIEGYMDIKKLEKYSDSIYMNNKHIFGKKEITYTLKNYKFLVSKDSFFQINKEVCLKVYDKVLEYIGKGEKCIDLFCGVGTISIFLAKNFKKIIGIEINKEAIKCAKKNAIINNIDNVEFKCADANIISKHLSATSLVVDPARSGLSPEGIQNILNIKPQKIVYVSCNPITLARDLQKLSKYYIVKDMTLFDMFPQTYHVECASLLCLKTLKVESDYYE